MRMFWKALVAPLLLNLLLPAAVQVVGVGAGAQTFLVVLAFAFAFAFALLLVFAPFLLTAQVRDDLGAPVWIEAPP